MNATFSNVLDRYGPHAKTPTPGLVESRAFCRHYAKSHSENFSVATLALPRRLVPHFYAIYAYCRFADDLADESGGGTRALELLAWWRDELQRCYDGHPRHPIMVALAESVERYAIPQRPFADLLFAFEQDQLVKRYATYDQLLDYCRHSADPVGRLLLHLFECYTPTNAVLADRICTALQLTNFWQDVSRDFAIGRVYLPEDDMAAFGYREADLKANRFTPEFAALMRHQVARARDLFYRGMPLTERVGDEFAVDVELFARGGLAILSRIERQGYDVWHRRPRLAKWEKAALAAGVLGRHWRERFWPTSRPRRNSAMTAVDDV